MRRKRIWGRDQTDFWRGVEKEGVTSKELAPGGVAESETGDQGGGEGGKGGRGGTCIWVTRSI